MKKLIVFSILLLACISCNAQAKLPDENFQETQDDNLVKIYQKFKENQHDYGENARDTILNRFRSSLLRTLKDPKFSNYTFDNLKKEMLIKSSKDNKLMVVSWDELNGGTWKIFNSAYRYQKGNKIYVDYLAKEIKTDGKIDFTDVNYYKIYKIKEDNYLVLGYGTHGHGHEFYTMRLMKFKENSLQDCKNCFDKKDQLVLYKTRGGDDSITYDPDQLKIQYPEYVEDKETGFMKSTGNTITLIYKDNGFAKVK
ncbi:hypothetical protein [Aquimarina sp. 2201CG5-10]|uniref:hypothetical protein n=1 Tax=Aquimarina callyspongiae TaxID=3098150 RepID=UPI002AB4D9E1|nr:hypothetical protein [Aquimarina sp. 2201CG5-10]MDY8138336.1 hypothetical protein [Aquimarina sp. 2201CG5-10]